jgi:hypothetical protein
LPSSLPTLVDVDVDLDLETPHPAIEGPRHQHTRATVGIDPRRAKHPSISGRENRTALDSRCLSAASVETPTTAC